MYVHMCVHYSSMTVCLPPQAHRLGRVDCFIQSTDKNLLVPVGGAIVASSNSEFVKQVSQIYPGNYSTVLN